MLWGDNIFFLSKINEIKTTVLAWLVFIIIIIIILEAEKDYNSRSRSFGTDIKTDPNQDVMGE
jgi:hypothetical protein